MTEQKILLDSPPSNRTPISSFREGCIDSIPVCLTFLFLFFSIGSLLNKSGYTLTQSIIMTIAVHAAPLQIFLAQNGGNISLIAIIAMTLIVNFRFLIMASVLSGYFKNVSLNKILWSTQLLSISTFTLSSTKKDKVDDLFSYYLGCGISTLSFATLATALGFLITSNSNNFINTLIAIILPVHFTALAAMMWPKIKAVIATIMGFLITPFAGALVGDYQIFFIPFLIGALLMIYNLTGDKK